MRVGRKLAMLAAWLTPVLAVRSEAVSVQPLPAFQVDLTQTTVSGLSSGAYMAGQFAVIHSSMITGAGIVAGGPYNCASRPGWPPFTLYWSNATRACMNPQATESSPPDAVVLWRDAQQIAQAGRIDALPNLRRQKIYLFSGREDKTVATAVVDQVRHFYALAGTASIHYRNDLQAGHGMVTNDPGDSACSLTAAPYFNNCGLPLAREMLSHLYPGLGPPSAQLSGSTIKFDQRRYAGYRAGLDDAGYAYVPAACSSRRCRVHVAFHGCMQGAALVKDHFYGRAGYNAVADANGIIVLYPQVRTSWFYPYNPGGCWDYWGYSSANPFRPDFHTREGAQVRAVYAMLQRLAQPRNAPHP
ncbi:poly(3-hydroxybutyrate) depolymerase [Massilia cavernae]|uniref:Poly(3-hydroxybutyrate) depolymerase n=2 Tax=Massilia cavernae TaxID=2320864 RepID=A0A418XTB6_9BURK|nr:poly(3-hydroxybutyrate) depolymerase [Massilia cavernae]